MNDIEKVIMDCLECKYWKQLPFDGEDICLKTEDENGMCLVIPVEDKIPDWCPINKQLENDLTMEKMNVNFVDCIPDEKPHCGNCDSWKESGELFAHCEKKDEDCPSFAVCSKWSKKIDDDLH